MTFSRSIARQPMVERASTRKGMTRLLLAHQQIAWPSAASYRKIAQDGRTLAAVGHGEAR